MAKYTITIKSLIDNNFDFGLQNYPIFNETYRNTLNNNILNHYYENEIGFETANLFKFYLNQKLNEIMPYYNELYKNQEKLIKDNLFDNVDLEETSNRINNTSTNSNSLSNSDSKNLFQDTPQGQISQTDIDNQTWATKLTLDKNTTNNTINDTSSNSGSANTNATNTYLKTIIGNNGGKFNIDILNDIKNNLMNIDMMIINDLNELFMQIF